MTLSKLAASMVLVGAALSFSTSIYATNYFFIFSGSQATSDNGLNIATTAGNLFVPVSSSGWWEGGRGFHLESNSNYFVSETDVGNYNNFFIFDLSDVSGSILSASLTLQTYEVSPNYLTYSLFDITSPLADVRADGYNLSIYNDLMSGVNYGSSTYSPADTYQVRSITLNDAGIGALNAARGGEFGIGGAVASIPEPQTYAMLLAGLGVIGWVGHRRQKAV